MFDNQKELPDMLNSKKLSKNNPIKIHNYKIASLEQATDALLNILEELSQNEELPTEAIEQVKKMIEKVSAQKKMSYLLEDKLGIMADYISDACRIALKSKSKNSTNEYTEVTYMNHTKQLLTNEYNWR